MCQNRTGGFFVVVKISCVQEIGTCNGGWGFDHIQTRLKSLASSNNILKHFNRLRAAL